MYKGKLRSFKQFVNDYLTAKYEETKKKEDLFERPPPRVCNHAAPCLAGNSGISQVNTST